MKLAFSAVVALVASLPTLASAQAPDAGPAPAPSASKAPASAPSAAPSPAEPSAPAPATPASEPATPSAEPAPASEPASVASPAPAPAPGRTRGRGTRAHGPSAEYRYQAPAVTAPAAETRPLPPPGPPRYDYLRVGLGFRVGYIDDPAFDVFAKGDTLAQVSLDASYAFYTRGKLAVSAGLAYDAGSRTSGARELTTKLTVHRITVPIEGRYYVAPWAAVFAKVAPGTAAFDARIEDPSSPSTLEHAPWVFAADLSAGASFRLVGSRDPSPRRPRLWVTTEVGYGITSAAALRPRADRPEEDVLGSDQPMRLGSLAANGVFWRMGVAVSF